MYIPKRPRIWINWNPPFQTQIYLIKVPLSVNIVTQDFPHKNQFLKVLWTEVWEEGFQLMLILVHLGMYFAAVMVFIQACIYHPPDTLIQIGSGSANWSYNHILFFRYAFGVERIKGIRFGTGKHSSSPGIQSWWFHDFGLGSRSLFHRRCSSCRRLFFGLSHNFFCKVYIFFLFLFYFIKK